ncbi:NucA/NucB deoxyribonuclease domain-containing protein [Streptomyces hokutonensis]|uniref:NucA/NucB deoxyribonuclease domain-containing protein n=1 Tax=Streptomyces hokutonensis TaxID=1306990 RepID=UPI00036308F6|nr:NucA/NucB deoxyribonuclease domain-containing protein [Streptomyces hokutonensis]
MTIRTTLIRLARATATATAVAVLMATATSAGHAAPAGNDPGPEVGTRFVDAASLPAEDLRGLGKPLPYAQYARSHHAKSASLTAAPVTAPDDEQDLRQECAAHAAQAKTAVGWIKSRFESCQKRPFDLVLRDVRGTTALGRLKFDQWVLGFAYDGSRRVDYLASIENIIVQPLPTEDATKWRLGQHFRQSVNASTSDPDPQVTAPQTTDRDELLGVWDTQPHWNLSYTAPDKGPLYDQGNQQKVFSTVSMDLSASSPNAAPYSEGGDVYTSSVRYDYAGKIAGKFLGTVFTQARVELVLSQKDPAVNESAMHIYDALNRPERTFPSWPGKTVPGVKEPLHRLVDKEKQKKNRARSIKECEKVWGDYKGTDLQCDEYPYASTKEGSTKGDNRFSVRLIDGTDNETGGRRLDQMYTLNRILDGDAFYMKITD